MKVSDSRGGDLRLTLLVAINGGGRRKEKGEDGVATRALGLGERGQDVRVGRAVGGRATTTVPTRQVLIPSVNAVGIVCRAGFLGGRDSVAAYRHTVRAPEMTFPATGPTPNQGFAMNLSSVSPQDPTDASDAVFLTPSHTWPSSTSQPIEVLRTSIESCRPFLPFGGQARLGAVVLAMHECDVTALY